MDKIDIKVEKVLERDIDLLFIDRFINNKNLVSYFLKLINKKDFNVISVEHSHYDNGYGESDITVIVEKDNYKIGLLIEDKINAEPMPKQYDRYNDRGKLGKNNDLYDEYSIFIVAPEQYLENNDEAHKYDYKVSYEELINVLKNDLYAVTLLEKAIEIKKNGYNQVVDEVVTDFWIKYYNYIQKNYNGKIKMNPISSGKGARSLWFYLKVDTSHKGINIIHKSNQGCIDLSFEQMGNYSDVFKKYVKKQNDINILQLDKSMVARINVPPMDIHSDFNSNLDNMDICMKAVLKLYDFLKTIDVDSMINEVRNTFLIYSVDDFKNYYPFGIIVNYDKRVTYRCKTGNLEKIGDGVNYPFIQRYQSGQNPSTILFIIKDGVLKRLERTDKGNENSSYKMIDINETISDVFYDDPIFLYNSKQPVNIKHELLLEIEDN